MEPGKLYRIIGKQIDNNPATYRSVPFYDNKSGKPFLHPGGFIMFLARERNWHWVNHEWYWWRVFSFEHNEIGYIGEDEALMDLTETEES